MATYLLDVSCTRDGVMGLRVNGGSARVAAVTEAVEGFAGTIDSFCVAFGETDVHLVTDYPDNVSVAALGMGLSAAGGAREQTTVLLTPADVDAATSTETTNRPPGA